MPDRILIGLSGGQPVFRISKSGKSVFSSDPADFILREDSSTFRPVQNGSYAFAGSGTHTVAINATLSSNPFIILKSSDDRLPALKGNGIAWPFGEYHAYLNAARTSLTLSNGRNVARTIYYWILEV